MSQGPVLFVPSKNLMLDLGLSYPLFLENFPIIPQSHCSKILQLRASLHAQHKPDTALNSQERSLFAGAAVPPGVASVLLGVASKEARWDVKLTVSSRSL